MRSLVFLFFLTIFNGCGGIPIFQKLVDFQYHDYRALLRIVKLLHTTKCAGITRMYSIGKSVQGRDLVVLELFNFQTKSNDFRPSLYFAGNIHGNEPVSKELLLHFVDDLCDEYTRGEPIADRILNNIHVHVLFSLNPDGFEIAPIACKGKVGRFNANGVDLNRNFPYLDFAPNNTVQPETRAVMRWAKEHYFVFSAVLHGGDVVVVYPYDGDHSQKKKFLPSQDNNYMVHASKSFASLSRPHLMHGCRNLFHEGIVNGADWYPALNTMQDYTMYETSGLQVTIELSCCKYPEASDLPELYLTNKSSFTALVLEALRGVKGRVIDKNHKPIPNAVIDFGGAGKPIHTTDNGDFMKNLLPGKYKMAVSLRDAKQKEKKVIKEFEVFDQFEPTVVTINFDQ